MFLLGGTSQRTQRSAHRPDQVPPNLDFAFGCQVEGRSRLVRVGVAPVVLDFAFGCQVEGDGGATEP